MTRAKLELEANSQKSQRILSRAKLELLTKQTIDAGGSSGTGWL